MYRTIKKLGILGFAIVMILTAACSNNAIETNEGTTQEESPQLIIKGLKDGDKTISIETIKEMESVTREMESISSSGEIKNKKVKGLPLEDLLGLYEASQKDYSGIRFIAGDSYSIVVPKEILDKREIVLAYEVNDEPLDKKTLPLMLAIPDERAMYWVKNLMEIELLNEESSAINKIVFLDTAVSSLESEDYTYYESQDEAVKVTDLLNNFSGESDKKGVDLKSVDGLEKEEDIEVFKTGYIKITGKDIPLFLSPDLPKGMHVKNILFFSYGETVYFSLNQALEAFEKKAIDDGEGIPLKSIFKELGIAQADKYLCRADDGYEVEIAADDVAKGLIYPRDKGGFALIFEGMPKNTKVKGILSIEAVK